MEQTLEGKITAGPDASSAAFLQAFWQQTIPVDAVSYIKSQAARAYVAGKLKGTIEEGMAELKDMTAKVPFYVRLLLFPLAQLVKLNNKAMISGCNRIITTTEQNQRALGIDSKVEEPLPNAALITLGTPVSNIQMRVNLTEASPETTYINAHLATVTALRNDSARYAAELLRAGPGFIGYVQSCARGLA